MRLLLVIHDLPFLGFDTSSDDNDCHVHRLLNSSGDNIFGIKSSKRGNINRLSFLECINRPVCPGNCLVSCPQCKLSPVQSMGDNVLRVNSWACSC